MNSEQADRRLTLDEQDELTIDDRLQMGDREAIYDAIVEAVDSLELMRKAISELLAEDCDVLDRLSALQRSRAIHGEPPIVRARKRQETAGSDASGKERQRSRVTGSTPASHG
jgi:hypothetical protein